MNVVTSRVWRSRKRTSGISARCALAIRLGLEYYYIANNFPSSRIPIPSTHTLHAALVARIYSLVARIYSIHLSQNSLSREPHFPFTFPSQIQLLFALSAVLRPLLLVISQKTTLSPRPESLAQYLQTELRWNTKNEITIHLSTKNPSPFSFFLRNRHVFRLRDS